MSNFFMVLFLVSAVCIIVFALKMMKLKKAGDDYSKVKTYALASVAVCFVSMVIGAATMPKEDKEEKTEVTTQTTTVETTEQEQVAEILEVQMNVTGRAEGNGIAFDIETNLPDDTELMLSLSQGDFNTDDAIMAQTKVTIKDGKSSSDTFLSDGLSGTYDLSVSMSMPKLQADSVQAVIGSDGENMSGPFVKKADNDNSNIISALFTVETEGDIAVTPSEKYQNTVFATEENDEEIVIDVNAGELGEYGQELVLNEGTEFEDKTIGYFVPAGKYEVTNIGDKMAQINVYKNEKAITDGWEEWADGKAELVDVNETKEMVVEDGYFFNVDPPAHFTVKKVD